MSVPLIPAARTPAGYPTRLLIVQVSGSTLIPDTGVWVFWNAALESWKGEAGAEVYEIKDSGGNWVVEEDGVVIGTKVNSSITPVGNFTTQNLLLVNAPPFFPGTLVGETSLTPGAPGSLEAEPTLSPGAPGSLIPEV